MTKEMMPTDSVRLQQLYSEFSEIFSWKIISRASSIEKYKLQQAFERQQRSEVNAIQQQISKDNFGISDEKKKALIDPLMTQFDVYSSEIDTYQSEIQNFMVLTAIRHIEREQSALTKAFELDGKRLEVLVNVDQQFAATQDDNDKLNHLDIVNKVGPIQKFLSQMKNRMLSIKNLTGGEGVMISKKDLLTILDDLCRSLIKSGEIEMRTRCQQLTAQITAYQDLLYGKDQQIYALEHKLRHASEELNKVVNVKVFARGNQIIYELDHSARQLRLIKDNLHGMQQHLTDSVRLEFSKQLEMARLELLESRKKFDEYKTTLNSHMSADI